MKGDKPVSATTFIKYNQSSSTTTCTTLHSETNWMYIHTLYIHRHSYTQRGKWEGATFYPAIITTNQIFRFLAVWQSSMSLPHVTFLLLIVQIMLWTYCLSHTLTVTQFLIYLYWSIYFLQYFLPANFGNTQWSRGGSNMPVWMSRYS